MKQALILSLPSKGLGFNISVYICKSEFRTSRRKHLVCYRQKSSTSCVPCIVKNYIYSICTHAYPIFLKLAHWITHLRVNRWMVSLYQPLLALLDRAKVFLGSWVLILQTHLDQEKILVFREFSNSALFKWQEAAHRPTYELWLSYGLQKSWTCPYPLVWEAMDLGVKASRPCSELDQDLTCKLVYTFLVVNKYLVHILLFSRANKRYILIMYFYNL